MARKYTNLHTATTLSGSVDSSVTTLPLTSLAGLPVTYPYNLILELGTAQIEVVSVTAAAGGTNLTVVRGQDGTTAQAHSAGATVVHGVVAQDLQEPADHIDASTNVHGLAGGAAVVGTTTTQTLTNKTISGASNTLSAIGDGSLVDIAGSKVTMPIPTLTVTNNATVGGTLAVTGTTTAGNVDAADVTASGTLDVTGNTTLGGTLDVTGATSVASLTAGASGLASAAVTGNATVGGTLGVTGTTTLGVVNSGNHGITGTLSVSGASTLTGNTTVGGTLGITGATTAAGVTATTITGTTINGSTDMQHNSRSLPRGIIGGKIYTNAANRVSGVTTEALGNMDTGSVTWDTGRRYLIHLYIRPSMSTAGSFIAALRLTNLAGGKIWAARFDVPVTTTALDIHYPVHFVPGSSGAATYVLTVESTTGVWLNGNAGGDNLVAVLVEDMGPSSGVTTVP